MEKILPFLGLYLVLINLVAFVAFGIDKGRAKRGAWRIPERTLLLLAAVGGSLGAYVGMGVFRHKTKHRKFTLTVPLLIACHVLLLLWLVGKLG